MPAPHLPRLMQSIALALQDHRAVAGTSALTNSPLEQRPHRLLRRNSLRSHTERHLADPGAAQLQALAGAELRRFDFLHRWVAVLSPAPISSGLGQTASTPVPDYPKPPNTAARCASRERWLRLRNSFQLPVPPHCQ